MQTINGQGVTMANPLYIGHILMNMIVEAHGSSSPNNNKIVLRSTDRANHANKKLWFYFRDDTSIS